MRKPGPRVDPDQFAAAVEACRSGMSARECARILKVSAPTILRWLKWAKAGLGPDGQPVATAPRPGIAPERLAVVVGRTAPAAPERPPTPPPPPADDHLGRLRWLTDRAIAMAEEAQMDPAGPNYSNVKGLLKMVADLAPVLARLERDKSENADVITIPRAELEAADQRIDALYDALLRVPVLCERCQARVKTEREAAAGYRPNPDAR